MSSETQRQNGRTAERRYRENNKEILKQRRKEAWQAALKDPAKMAKIQKNKQDYRKRHRQKLASKQRQWVKDNPEKVVDGMLKANFGISLSEYQERLSAQDGVCAICKRPETAANKGRLAVDHSHDTGQLRGLLCSRCNNGIGQFQEDPQLLINAISYLAKWGIVVVPPEDAGDSP